MKAVRGCSKPPRIMTARRVETITQTRRAEERRISDLLTYKNESQRLSMAVKNEAQLSSMLDANIASRVEAESNQHQKEFENNELKRRDTLIKEKDRQSKQKHAEEMARRGKIELEIQRMCESSEELKELQRNLNIAYVNKERAAQHQESLLMKKDENAREQAIEEKMEVDRQALIHNEEVKLMHRRDGLVAQKIQLQLKMQEDEKARVEESYKEALRDKLMVDEILAKINDEDRKEIARKNKKVEETRLLIKQYQKEQEHRRKDLERQEKEHEKKISEYNETVQKRHEEELRQKQKANKEKEKMWMRVAQETQNFSQSKEEYNELRNFLWEQELEEKQRKEEEEAIMLKLALKETTLQQNLEQIDEKKKMMKNMEEDELRLVQRMLDKFDRDEKEEKDRQEAIFNAKENFVAEAQKQRNERKQMFMEEKQNEYKERYAGDEQEEYRQRVIAEARKKLLEEHATHVKGFLPKGTLVNQEEANYFS